MYITVDDIKHEVSLYYPIDNRNANKKVGLIRAYFVYSFYNVEKNEKIHFKNGETLPVKKGCYTTKDIEKVSSGKVKCDSLTGKSVIDPTISRFGPYMIDDYDILYSYYDCWKTTAERGNAVFQGIVEADGQTENAIKHRINAAD